MNSILNAVSSNAMKSLTNNSESTNEAEVSETKRNSNILITNLSANQHVKCASNVKKMSFKCNLDQPFMQIFKFL